VRQLWLASIGTTVPTVNVSATALRFFFKVTLRRHDLAEKLVSTRCSAYPIQLRQATKAMAPEMASNTTSGTLARAAAGA
jgi:hypothetical protein